MLLITSWTTGSGMIAVVVVGGTVVVGSTVVVWDLVGLTV